MEDDVVIELKLSPAVLDRLELFCAQYNVSLENGIEKLLTYFATQLTPEIAANKAKPTMISEAEQIDKVKPARMSEETRYYQDFEPMSDQERQERINRLYARLRAVKAPDEETPEGSV